MLRNLKKILKKIILKTKYFGKNISLKTDYIQLNKVILENNVSIERMCIVEKEVKIGSYTYIQPYGNLNNCEIGKFCSIGLNVTIGPWQHPINNISTSPRLYRDIFNGNFYSDIPKKTLIGNDVWIGNNVIIMGGVKIGDGAVIGAGSIVTHNIPPYAVVVGNPGKILKYRFSQEKIKYLLDIKWWDWSIEKIKENKLFFEEVEEK